MKDRENVSVQTAQMMIGWPMTDFLSLGCSREPDDTQRASFCATGRAVKYRYDQIVAAHIILSPQRIDVRVCAGV